MRRTIFRKPTAFSKWVFVFAGLGLALLLPGLVAGKEFMVFFGCLGGVWIMVAVLVGIVVALAGKGQVAELSREGETLTVRTVGLFGPGRSFNMPSAAATNWRWLMQGGDRHVGPRLLMLAFDFKGGTYQLPISTAEVVDLEVLRVVAPEQVIDDMIAQNPGRAEHRPERSRLGVTLQARLRNDASDPLHREILLTRASKDSSGSGLGHSDEVHTSTVVTLLTE